MRVLTIIQQQRKAKHLFSALSNRMNTKSFRMQMNWADKRLNESEVTDATNQHQLIFSLDCNYKVED